jgi:hypothetical protein
LCRLFDPESGRHLTRQRQDFPVTEKHLAKKQREKPAPKEKRAGRDALL